MSYIRPMIVNSLRASSVVMGVGKIGGAPDNDVNQPDTTPAYEADE
jgi:hypothetical protein